MTQFLPLILKVLGWMIGKHYSKTKANTHFVALVGELEFGGLKSVKLRESARQQINAHKNKLMYPESLELSPAEHYNKIQTGLYIKGLKMDHNKKKVIPLS